MFAASAFAATIFMGGWQGLPFISLLIKSAIGVDILPGWLWFILKSYLMVFVMIWLRGTLPRLRVDQLMNFAWKVLVPLSLVNLLFAGVGLTILTALNFTLDTLAGAGVAFVIFLVFNAVVYAAFRALYKPPKIEKRSVVLVPRATPPQPMTSTTGR